MTRETRDFWVMFFKDPSTGSVSGSACGHNCIADYRSNPYFIGATKITVNMGELSK